MQTSTPDPPPPTGAAASSSSPPAASFDFPREYSFPPFFTRQANLTTYHSQLEKWAALVLAYCRHHRLFKLSLSGSGAGGTSNTNTEELFCNRRLGRRLSTADARDVLEFMRKDGRAEFVDGGGGGGGGDVAFIYWKTPEEWARELEVWVDETAQKGTVLTLYELTEGEDTRGTEFHGLDPDLLQKALQVLVKRGKAQIFGQEDQQGVKFF